MSGISVFTRKRNYTWNNNGEDRRIVENRAEKLKVDELHIGIKNKLYVVKTLGEKYDVILDEVAYIGDDINDLEVVKVVGFGCSVNDGMKFIKDSVVYVTRVKGVQGTVREVAEKIL